VSDDDASVLLVNVCVSVRPTSALAGAVRDVPQALPVEIGTPAPGYTIEPLGVEQVPSYFK